MRNSPLVAGAITWSRALLKKIEDPMRIFKENKFITSYRVRNLSWVEFYGSAPKRKSLRRKVCCFIMKHFKNVMICNTLILTDCCGKPLLISLLLRNPFYGGSIFAANLLLGYRNYTQINTNKE